jgi:CheY-like chemotaxis protein
MILVVDDNRDLREMICLLLAGMGHQTAAASNGKEAIQWLLASHLPNVILLDLTMPVMDGYQFLAAREVDPALMQVPVVVMSAVHECARLLGRYWISTAYPNRLARAL